MDRQISEMKMYLSQGNVSGGLDRADKLLAGLDLDDDDDLERLYLLWKEGLGSGHTREFIEFMVARHSNFSITWPGKGGLALLYVESFCNDPALFAILEEQGMDPLLTARDGNTVLHLLARMGKSPWAKAGELEPKAEFVRSREDISGWMVSNAYGATPLHLAVLSKNVELLRALLEKGVNPDLCGDTVQDGFSHVINFHGVTAFQLACSIGDAGIASLLLDSGAQENLKDAVGRSACHYALELPNKLFCEEYYNSIPCEQRIQEQKADIIRRLSCIDEADDKGITPLLKSLADYRYDAGEFGCLLIEKGADVNHTNNLGFTPLMLAAANGHMKTMKALVEAKAELDSRNLNGDTALLLAVKEHKEKEARYLLRKGANPDLPNNEGITAGELAAQKGMEAVLELLIS